MYHKSNELEKDYMVIKLPNLDSKAHICKYKPFFGPSSTKLRKATKNKRKSKN